MAFDHATGLRRIDIRPETPAFENAVVQYIARTRNWKRAGYRMESRGCSADGNSDVVAVIHSDDERATSPGAGQPVELYVDRISRHVTKEKGWQ
jgi:hypothetical protein